MGRREKRVDDLMEGLFEEVRGELRGILEELEIYQRTWMMPWFVQKLLNDLYMRLSLLLEKLGSGEGVN